MIGEGKISGVILAGGRSSRMGENKAQLPFHGRTLLEHQVHKLQSAGVGDIVIAGCPVPVPGTRFAADRFPGKGPLGGIHAGLCAAEHEHCLVLGIDTPLVPEELLRELVRAQLAGGHSMTVLSHGNELEPLIGVYEKSLAPLAEEILRTDRTSVRVLYEKARLSCLAYTGDEALLCGCNTPEEYQRALQLAKAKKE